jgi:hypothetical protein
MRCLGRHALSVSDDPPACALLLKSLSHFPLQLRNLCKWCLGRDLKERVAGFHVLKSPVHADFMNSGIHKTAPPKSKGHFVNNRFI